jgi:methyltransferase (TIGR00027 family)
MDIQRGSQTAEAVAAARAWGSFSPEPKLFDDPYAIFFTSPLWRSLIKNRLLRLFTGRFYNWWVPGIVGEVLVRSRYTEDHLQACVDQGLNQYVILGAGLDSFGWRRRDLENQLHIFELDHPLTQSTKKRKLSKLGLPIPKNLTFIPIDFERTSLDQALKRSNYICERLALYNWLGVSMYLTEEAALRTLKAIVSIAAPGSEIIFDYLHQHVFSQRSGFKTFRRHQYIVARRRERFISGFKPETLGETLNKIGFELVENLSPTDQKNRYFHNPQIFDIQPCEYIYIARARVI